MLRMAGRLSNGINGPRHNQVNAQLTEFGARPARVAVGSTAGLQAIGPHQVRVDGKRQRGVGETGVGPDFVFAKTLARQQPAEFALTRPVIFLNAMDTGLLRGPFLVQAVRNRLLVLLVRAVIAEKDDLAES